MQKIKILSYTELIILAFGLSMDSFAISIANGIAMPDLKFRKALVIGIIMGSFHVLMPITGYYFAHSINDFVKGVDHWLAFILLGFIGGKMIYESVVSKQPDADHSLQSLKIGQLITQSFATSIDALVVGITLGFIQIQIISSSLIIGSVSFLMVMIGLKAGVVIGSRLGKKMEFIGGIILILIGFKILIEHLYI